jgi:hypothetical protein
VRFEVLTAVKMPLLLSWVVTLVVRYQRYGETYSIISHERHLPNRPTYIFNIHDHLSIASDVTSSMHFEREHDGVLNN